MLVNLVMEDLLARVPVGDMHGKCGPDQVRGHVLNVMGQLAQVVSSTE